MNYEKIKSIYEKMPKKYKFMLTAVFKRLITWNPTYRKTMRELIKYDALSEGEKNSITWGKLKETLIYAYEHTSYYREIFDSIQFNPKGEFTLEEFQKIPMMDKNIALQQGERIYSDEKIAYYESHTSGSSTGKVFKVLLDKDSIYKERAFVTHYLSKFGYDPLKTKTLAFWGHNKDTDYYYSPMKNEIVISPFRLFKEEEFENVWKDIVEFQPDMIAGYPSALYIFAQLINKYNKHLNIKLVEFYAENYTDEIKEYVEQTFGCVTTATYGHTERAVFGELYDEGYKMNDLYGFTEFIPFDNENGETMYRIVCTGFNSRKMPLIRYATDDVVTFDSNGNMNIHGHTTSEARVIGKNGARIYKGTLSPHIKPFEKVKLYQYVQHEKGKVFLDLVLEQSFVQEDFDILNEYYKRKCEGILDVEIRIVEKVILNGRGKYNWLVSYLK